ncbi:HipA domain-containing protein, partial [Brucella sp. NBRC 113783]
LWFEAAGGREHSSFQYDSGWLEHPRGFAIAPALTLDADRKFFRAANEHGTPLPPPVADTTPDSWGRNIIRKDVRLGGNNSNPLTEIDFLTAVDDFSRVGALRVRSLEEGSPFLSAAPNGRHPIPPLLHLDQLSHAIASAESNDPDAAALRRLRQVGSTLGGARPKCSVIDSDGTLSIAKFTSIHDTYPVERAEVLTLRLAKLCGIEAPKARIEMSAGLPVAIIERFDRTSNGRVPYISAQTMLDLPTATGGTYLNLADTIREQAAAPYEELRELFRRVSFNILVSNVDDHLKNHGFLYAGDGRWRLSPVFDVNPAPERFKELKTAIADPAAPDASISMLMEYAFYFEIDPDDAAKTIGEMAHTISQSWESLAREAGMNGAEIGIYRPAFEHKEAEYARSLVEVSMLNGNRSPAPPRGPSLG